MSTLRKESSYTCGKGQQEAWSHTYRLQEKLRGIQGWWVACFEFASRFNRSTVQHEICA